MDDHHSHEKRISSTVQKSFDQPEFVSAAMMASSARTNVRMIPEISDDELMSYDPTYDDELLGFESESIFEDCELDVNE